MKINFYTEKKETSIISRLYFTKKFQGLVFSIDCDVPQLYIYKTVFVFTIKFIFFGFWIAFDTKNIYKRQV